MAKLDEIMEVLTQEISGFNASMDKLTELSKKLNNVKVQADSSMIEAYLKDFLRLQQRKEDSSEKRTQEILTTVKKARLMPKLEGIVLYIFLCMNTIAFSYLGYYFIQFEDKKEAAFIMGKEAGMDTLRSYFNDHPIVYKDFVRWARKKDSVSNQK
ncbi:DUF6730 family protein [Kriegella aquimaris]|uniref:Uncharacterized protein n=1 Tax=Kriegella aquimaris TaxID=192904 RepID=A0A1G9VJ73_9FLAO|nr:DUF6730 family protein [Kriegella aquimaris]SDM72091.1 hypothetical protein SAMN04488514_113103 [Kriegella aquimaris]